MSEVINFYELDEVKKFGINHHNPTYDFEKQPLKHPMRLVVCGASGSGKTNIICNIIKLMDETFEKIIIFTQDKDEQLYNYLANKLDPEVLEIYEGIENVISYDWNYLEDGQYLIIFDDMCIEKENKQAHISELFIRGRKMAQQKGVSVVYLTQSYFQVPPIVRKQMTGLILRKINGKRDLNSILNECSIDATKKQNLLNMYTACCDPKDITAFLFIDLSAPEEFRFRYQFDEVLNINDFS
jgi:ABC-type dipeptide/oligopeptide/nickel transport system ATPase component